MRRIRYLVKANFAYLAIAIITLFLAISAKSLFTVPDDRGVSALLTDRTLFTTPTGELYEWSDVKIGAGGFVTGLVIHPKAADIVYARTDVGGVFRWNPANQSWMQLLQADSLPEKVSYSIESVAIAPSDLNVV